MTLHGLDTVSPSLAEGAWAAPSADLIGDVRLGRRASVWFGAIIRADNTPILIGDDSNIQDGSICHSDPGFPLTIGARVTIGHQAILHGCTIGSDCLIGMGAKLLLIVGTPGRVVRRLSDEEKHSLRASAALYADKAARYAAGLKSHG